MRPIRLPVLLALAGVASFGCKSTSAPPTPVPTSMAVNTSTVDLAALGATASVTATVLDQDGNAMSGQAVTWVSANSSVASVTGAATGTITAVGNGSTIVSVLSGSLSAQVTVNVTQVTSQIVKISGDGQAGTVGAALGQPLLVEQRDSQGNPVPGGTGGLAANTTVTFAVATGGGTLSATAVTVGGDGRASTSWTLGIVAGDQQTVTATAGTGGAGSATFSATAAAGPAAALQIVSGDDQTGTVGVFLPDSLVVRVVDQYGNAVAGHQVSFSATSGGGSVSPPMATTGANGQAATRWTLGATPGAQTAEAQAQPAITGSPAVFDAVASSLAITAIAPDTMVEGSSVTITGTGFDAVPGNNTVTIDGTGGTVTVASATSLTVTVPAYNCRPIRAVNVQVSVGGASSNTVSHPLKPTGVLSLAVGEQQLVRNPANFCLQFAASAAGGDSYLVGVGAAAETPSSTMPFTLTSVVGASAAPPAATSLATRRASGTGAGAVMQSLDEQWARHYRAEARIREWERAMIPTLGRPLPDRRGASAAGAPRAARAVGDTVVFRVPNASGNPCTSYATVTTVVRAVGTAGIWHTDIANPTTDSLTTAEIQAYSDTFDVHIYARDTLYFGSPSDIDANAKVEIVLSIEVNKLPGGFAGFVFGGDLFSRAVCASSDSSELFYGHVPDPGNTAGTGARSKASVVSQMPSLIAHEFTHNIQQSRRLVLLGASNAMATWEAEGQAMLAQEIVGHSVLGNAVGQNYTSATALQGQGNRWYGQAFRQLATYFGQLASGKAVGAPELCTLFGSLSLSTPCETFHFYGASWSFQRYVSDRFGSGYTGGEIQLHRDLVSKFPNVEGAANWEGVLGMSFDTLQARWAGMLYGDDRVTGLAPAVGMPSWNVFEIFSSFPNDNYRLIPVARQFAAFSDSRSVRGGSTAYTLIGSAGARAALAVRVRDGSDAVLTGVMEPVVWVLRSQ